MKKNEKSEPCQNGTVPQHCQQKMLKKRYKKDKEKWKTARTDKIGRFRCSYNKVRTKALAKFAVFYRARTVTFQRENIDLGPCYGKFKSKYLSELAATEASILEWQSVA